MSGHNSKKSARGRDRWASRGKYFKERKVLKQLGKRHEKGQQAVHDQSMTMEKSLVTMNDRTDKEHEE